MDSVRRPDVGSQADDHCEIVQPNVGVVDDDRGRLPIPDLVREPSRVEVDNEQAPALGGQMLVQVRLARTRLADQQKVAVGVPPQPFQVGVATDEHAGRRLSRPKRKFGECWRVAFDAE